MTVSKYCTAEWHYLVLGVTDLPCYVLCSIGACVFHIHSITVFVCALACVCSFVRSCVRVCVGTPFCILFPVFCNVVAVCKSQ